MSNDISNFTISPAINNRSQYNACGAGAIDTLSQFNLGMYTSGPTNTAGFSLQGANGSDINSNPVVTTRLWINELSAEVPFIINTPQLTINNNLEMTGSITTSDTSANLKNTSITPLQIEVRDEINGPLGDPIFTQITPNQIYMESQNNTQETLTLSVPVINMTNTNTGFINDITPSNITIQDTAGNNITSLTNLIVSTTDNITGLATVMSSGAITSNNWTIDGTGLGTFNTLTVNSIALITTLTLSGTTLNIPLGGHAIDRSWAITMNNNITVLNPSTGVNGGVYKLWLTVGATPRTFTKACGVINNLLGDTLMAANSIWLIEIYKRSAGNYRSIFTNFT